MLAKCFAKKDACLSDRGRQLLTQDVRFMSHAGFPAAFFEPIGGWKQKKVRRRSR